MNREQAKEILQAHRPGGEADSDPLFAEALALARHDSELSAWMDEQARLDAAISRKLKQFAAPADLRAQIFAAAAVRRVHRGRQALAMAACLAGLMLLTGLWLALRKGGTATEFEVYRSDMANFLQEFPTLDVEMDRLSDIRQWLATRHAFARVEIPTGLGRFPGIGCRTVEWQRKQLALVCFMVDGEPVHLFVMHQSEFPDGVFSESPQFARVNRMTTAAWEKDGVAYLALTKGEEALLRKYL
jgi:hypothetical protein